MKIARRASARHYAKTGGARRCRMATPLFIKRFFVPSHPLVMASNLLNRIASLTRMEIDHEKHRACHIALRRTRAWPRRLSTRNEHVAVTQYATGRDAEVVDLDAAARVAESIDVVHLAWNGFVDVNRRAAQGRQVADRSTG